MPAGGNPVSDLQKWVPGPLDAEEVKLVRCDADHVTH